MPFDVAFVSLRRGKQAFGAAWSKTKALGFALKKHSPSDCDLRNLRSVGEGAAIGIFARIAAVQS
jgi:hypothetical protein